MTVTLLRGDYNAVLNLSQTLMIAMQMSEEDRLKRYGTEGLKLVSKRVVEILEKYH